MKNGFVPLCIIATFHLFALQSQPVEAQHVIDKSDYESMALLNARMGKTDEALLYFGKAIEKSPDNFGLYINRASALLNAKQSQKALADLEKADTLMKGKRVPPFIESGFMANKGAAYAALNRDNEAIKCLLRAIELSPKSPSAHQSLADLYVKTGDKKLALQHLRIAREQYPPGFNLKFIDADIEKLEGQAKSNKKVIYGRNPSEKVIEKKAPGSVNKGLVD